MYLPNINAFLFLFLARLRGVHDGLFTGQIDAVDTLNATYRVTFDRAGLGTHTIPDYEVLVSVSYYICVLCLLSVIEMLLEITFHGRVDQMIGKVQV